MSNNFYNPSGYPSTRSPGSSLNARAEFLSIQAGFDKMPTLTGNGGKLLRVNAGATALEAFTHSFLDTATAASTYVAKAGDAMSGVLTVAGAAQAYGNLNVWRYGAAPYSSLTVADFTTATNTVGIYLRQTSGAAGISTAGADLTFYRAGPGTTAAGTISGATGGWSIPAPSSDVALVLNAATGYDGLKIDTSSAAAESKLSLYRNAVLKTVIANIGTAGTIINGSLQGDLALRTQGGQFLFSVDSGTTTNLKIGTAGNFTIAAPSSGTALLVNQVSGQPGIQIAGTQGSLFLTENAVRTWFIGAGNSATNQLCIADNTRGAYCLVLNQLGNFTLNAPSSGTTLALNVLASNDGVTWTDGTVSGKLGTIATTSVFFGAGSNHGLQLRTNNADRISVTAAGNVTINTPASGVTLRVNGANAPGGDVMAFYPADYTTNKSALFITNSGTDEWNLNTWDGTDQNGNIKFTCGTLSYNGTEIGYRVIPRTTDTTVNTAKRGFAMAISAGVTIPASTFAAGDSFCIYNDSASSITLTQGASLTLRLVGTATTGNRTLAARGFATIWFNSATEAVISGGGVS